MLIRMCLKTQDIKIRFSNRKVESKQSLILKKSKVFFDFIGGLSLQQIVSEREQSECD